MKRAKRMWFHKRGFTRCPANSEGEMASQMQRSRGKKQRARISAKALDPAKAGRVAARQMESCAAIRLRATEAVCPDLWAPSRRELIIVRVTMEQQSFAGGRQKRNRGDASSCRPRMASVWAFEISAKLSHACKDGHLLTAQAAASAVR